MNPYIGLDFTSTVILEEEMLKEIIEVLEIRNKVSNKTILLERVLENKDEKFPILILNVDNPIEEGKIARQLKNLKSISIREDIKIILGKVKKVYKIYIETDKIYILNEPSTEEEEYQVIKRFIKCIEKQDNRLGILLKNNIEEYEDKRINIEDTINCLKFTLFKK